MTCGGGASRLLKSWKCGTSDKEAWAMEWDGPAIVFGSKVLRAGRARRCDAM